MKEIEKGIDGICPRCKENVDYGDGYIEDGYVNYEWKCPKCGLRGVEVYEITNPVTFIEEDKNENID